MKSSDDSRISREHETREAESREEPWRPPNMLPDPHPRPGLVHRYIRTSSQGQSDPVNISQSFREGWTPVLAADYPELQVMSDHGTRWPEGIEIGGLLLCSAPAAKVKGRDAYYAEMAARQIKSVNDQLESEQDPRFRTMFRDHRTTVSRGFGPAGRQRSRAQNATS